MHGRVLAERLGEEGMISIEGIVDGYVFLYRQPPRAWTFEIDVHVAVPGVGKAIEKKMLGDTVKNFEKMVGFTNSWIRDRGLAAAC